MVLCINRYCLFLPWLILSPTARFVHSPLKLLHFFQHILQFYRTVFAIRAEFSTIYTNNAKNGRNRRSVRFYTLTRLLCLSELRALRVYVHYVHIGRAVAQRFY